MLVNLDQPGLILDDILVDRSDSNRIFAAGNRGNGAGGFFYSKDGGRTWTAVKELADQSVHSLTQAEFDPKVVLVGTTIGVWRSNDSGETFERVQSPSMPINVNSMAVDPRNLSTIYAGTWYRPYKSTDAGQSWRLIKNGMIDDSDVFAISINTRDPNHIFASACSGIYESTNGGEQWRKIQGIPSTSRRTRDILIHPSDPSRVFAATTEGFWMSANGGKTWSMTTQRNLEINSIAVHPDAPNRVIIGTNNYGVMISNDGGRSFAQSNNNFTSRFTYSITADVSRPDRLYATTKNTSSSGGFVYLSNDAGRSWTQVRGLDINRHAAFAILQDRTNEDIMYLGTNVGMFISRDRGVSWTLLTPPRAAAPARRMTPAQRRAAEAAAKRAASAGPITVPALGERIKVLAHTNDERNGILAGTDKGIYRTYDPSKGWEKLTITGDLDANILAIHTSDDMPGTIWAGTSRSGVIVSKDNGKTWEKTGSSPDNIPISSIASDPKRPNYIYVGTIHSLYVSRDGGRTWERRGGNLPLGNYTSILINPNNTDEIFVSSALENDGGIFHSDNAGRTWKRFDSRSMTLPSRRVWSLVFDPSDPNRMFAGSHSSGVYVINRKQEIAKDDRTSGKPTGN
ncbi:WD40/YVTN/BNR-like repeat-containing protein [Leptolyngbya sp. 7M]|uniref:WD40/YVTN/BNR-like repeat-containing protein n=1 Tax=Leptolyngbya sp. 7M TaxID=2812896 RepID=UPI001B8B5222|nr:hypothetical protein [Leptolyngbya sp. 7M]QYO67630.1 hypothetical protein JVX88_13045 [Leptolyngbya sp. 7M]